MFAWKFVLFIEIWATYVLAQNQLAERTVSNSANATSLSSSIASVTSVGTGPTCCYLSSFEVGQVLWYSYSIDITIATISTIVYKYDNTAVTRLVTATNSTALSQTSFEGVPTSIIGTDLGVYKATTTLIRGTAFTDPYGVVYQSPTPVWIYTDVIYATSSPVAANGGYVCPDPVNATGSKGEDISPYPSGFFIADDDSTYGWNNTGSVSTTLPTKLREWMASHTASMSSGVSPNLGNCQLGGGKGAPTAYIPVNEITATVLTTTTMTGNYGVTASPSSESITTSSSSAESIADSSQYTITRTTHSSITVSVTGGTKIGSSLQFPQATGVLQTETSIDPITQNAITTTSGISTLLVAQETSLAVFSNGESSYTADAASNYIIGSSTLTAGGSIVVSSSTYILPTSGAYILINGATQTISRSLVTTSASSRYIVIGPSTIIEDTASAFVANSQTLTKGGVVTAAGETISMASEGGSIVVIMDWESTSSFVSITAASALSSASTQVVNASDTSNSDLKAKVDVWRLGSILLVGIVGVLVL